MHILTKRGNSDNIITYEHICDTTEDMAFIERKYITLGSTCIVLTGGSGGMEVYMADSNKEWHDIMMMGDSNAASGLELHICTAAEVQDGKPNVETPLESTLYLVPSGAETGNLYDEYVYVNQQWELFGGARVNMDGYATENWVQQQDYVPVSSADAAAFYGLAKAAGDTTQAQSSNAVGTYTDEAKTAIQEMLDVPSNNAIATATAIENVLPAPSANGTALVYVDGEWTTQTGYGYKKQTMFTLMDLTNTDFTQNVNGYTAQVAADTTLLEKLQSMFFNNDEFEVDIDGTVYNSVTDEFVYDPNTVSITKYESTQVDNTSYIFRLTSDLTNIYLTTPSIPNHAKVYMNIEDIVKIDRELSPLSDIPIYKGTGVSSIIENMYYENTASGNYSHSEGESTTASGSCSHAEGNSTTASGFVSHAEGMQTTASGLTSHAEGDHTTASGLISHAEGYKTTASGSRSHAEGASTTASEYSSHAEGWETKASSAYQHVQGKYNVEDADSVYADIVGNGTGNNARSNAYTLDWDGNGWYAGNLTVNGGSITLHDETGDVTITAAQLRSLLASL